MLKKIGSVITVLVIVVALGGAIAYQAGYIGDIYDVVDMFKDLIGGSAEEVPENDFTYELEEADTPVQVGTVKFNQETVGSPKLYEELMKNTNAAYLWESEYYADGYGGYISYVESISREEFDKRLQNSEYATEDGAKLNLDLIEEKAKLTIETLTNTSKAVRSDLPEYTEIYVGYNEETPTSCFDGAIVAERGASGTDEDEFFRKNGLSLKCSNVKLGSILSGEDLTEGNSYTMAKISADVTCRKNNKTFKDLEWIPAEGETRRVEFLVGFYEINQIICYASIIDIVVLDYEQ